MGRRDGEVDGDFRGSLASFDRIVAVCSMANRNAGGTGTLGV